MSKIELSFTNCGSEMIVEEGKKLKQGTIAGANKKYVWVQAKIEGNKIVVCNEKFEHPVLVRYTWTIPRKPIFITGKAYRHRLLPLKNRQNINRG